VNYATLDALSDRLGADTLLQLADRSGAGVVDQGVVDRALADTDAVIDASLAVRYRLPLAAVPAIVVDLALSIASYKLHRFAPDEKIKDDYDQALRDLRDIADGRKRLDLDGREPVGSGGGGVVVTDRERPLSAKSMTGFI
jgi:phage gp36-like protein